MPSKLSYLLCLGLWLCCVVVVAGRPSHHWKPSDLPSPQNDPRGVCQRNGLKSAVCDPDAILSVSQRDEIEGMINFIAEGTNGFEVAQCGAGFEGYQFALLVVEHMSEAYYRFQDKAQRAKHFAKDIHDSWGVGDAQCQNGVLVFFSIADKQMYVSTGRGAKTILTDKVVHDILSGLRPLMRKEQYGKAMLVGIQRMGQVLSGKLDPADLAVDTGDGWFASLFGLVFFSFCCCSGYQERKKLARYRRCKAALKRIDDDTISSNHGAGRTRETSCPICLEPFSGNETKNKQDGEEPLLDATEKEKDPSGPRVALPCGHEFHENCIREWTESDTGRNRTTCPVCRKPVDGSDANAGGAARASEESNWADERRFRIRRAHDIYPDFVTYSMMERYQNNRDLQMASHRDFVQLDPVVVAEARNAGSGGSTYSFGGGSSSGGGGGGSSW